MTTNTCYFTLHRVSNIDVHNAENSISGLLDSKIFWRDMPPDPPSGSRLRRSYLITPLNKYSCQYEHPSKNLSYAPEMISAFLKSASTRKPGGNRQKVIQLKSPISLKLGTNVGHDELSLVTKHKVKIFYSLQVMGPSAKMAIFL